MDADVAMFAALEDNAPERPLFFVELRDKHPASELQRVKSFRSLFRKHFPGAILAAVPNGGQRGQGAISQAKSEGALWGFPDLIAIGSAPCTAFLEFKSGVGALKAHQIAVLNRMHAKGHRVGVFRQPETAIQWLFERGFRA
jgi:hypothetical protein